MHRLLCIGLVLFALLAVAFAGTCSSNEYKKIVKDNIEYTIYGGRLEGRVVVDGVVIPGNTLIWSIDQLVERARVEQIRNGRLIDWLCVGPTHRPETFFQFQDTGLALVDPLSPRTNDSCPGSIGTEQFPCGDLITTFNAADFDCDLVHTNVTVAGHLVETIYVNMTHPVDPTRNLVTSFQLPSQNFTYRHILPNNQVAEINYRYVPFLLLIQRSLCQDWMTNNSNYAFLLLIERINLR